jgi:hypothetical protein
MRGTLGIFAAVRQPALNVGEDWRWVRSEISKVYSRLSGSTAVHARASWRLLLARHQGPRGQTVATGVESEGCGYGGPAGWGITSRVGPA